MLRRGTIKCCWLLWSNYWFFFFFFHFLISIDFYLLLGVLRDVALMLAQPLGELLVSRAGLVLLNSVDLLDWLLRLWYLGWFLFLLLGWLLYFWLTWIQSFHPILYPLPLIVFLMPVAINSATFRTIDLFAISIIGPMIMVFSTRLLVGIQLPDALIVSISEPILLRKWIDIAESAVLVFLGLENFLSFLRYHFYLLL